jgi:hypothetical protein
LPAPKPIPDLAPIRGAFKPLGADKLGELAFDRLVDQGREHGARSGSAGTGAPCGSDSTVESFEELVIGYLLGFAAL